MRSNPPPPPPLTSLPNTARQLTAIRCPELDHSVSQPRGRHRKMGPCREAVLCRACAMGPVRICGAQELQTRAGVESRIET